MEEKYTKENIINIIKEKNTIPLEKIEFNAFDYTTDIFEKQTEWRNSYFIKSDFNALDINKFKTEVYEYLKTINDDIILDFEIDNYKCDFYIKDMKIAIICMGLFEYSEINVEKYHQVNTHKTFTENNIKCIQIFEDEWIMKSEIIKSRISNICGFNKIIYARKCTIKVIKDSKICTEFLNRTHMQGSIGSKVKLGLYFNDKLVAMMIFGGLRVNMGNKPEEGAYEMLRFSSELYTNVIGGVSKLFKYFIKNFDVSKVISYADKRWSGNSTVYDKLGLNKVEDSMPSYFYIRGTERMGRYSYRKSKLLDAGFDGDKITEHTGMLSLGMYRIYDCGTAKYIYEKNNK